MVADTNKQRGNCGLDNLLKNGTCAIIYVVFI